MQNKILQAIILIALVASSQCHRPRKPLCKQKLKDKGDLTPSVNILSERIYSMIRARRENFSVSAASIYLCLSMLLEGAEGQNQRELATLLRVGTEGGDRKAALQKLLGGLNEVVQGLVWDNETNQESMVDIFKSMVANSFWVSQDLQIKDSFKDTLEKVYGAEAINADFKDPSTIEKINEWVSIKTNKLIPQALDQLDADTLLVLINTLYFKARWLNPFQKENTKIDNFKAIDGKVVKKDYMVSYRTNAKIWRDSDGSEYLLLPYQSGKHAMLIKFGFNPLDHISQRVIEELETSSRTTLINLYMPKFDYETDIDLIPILKRLGVNSIFSPSKTGFRGITTQEDLAVSQAIHKTKVITDELGTEAAAATIIVMRKTAVQTEQPREIKFDRPFSYYIVDTEKKLILFAGALVK